MAMNESRDPIKLIALTMIAFVFVNQTLQIAVIIVTANLHVQAFAARVACYQMKPPNSQL